MSSHEERRTSQIPRRSEDSDPVEVRQLTFLSDFSRTIVSSLNPDEMFAKFTEEFEQGLPYSHIGIGLLEYSSKEVIVMMEAGRRKGALNRHFGLEGNVLGKVARTGEMALEIYQSSPNTSIKPILEGSISSIALPIVFRDQLHGVFYIETDTATDFSEDRIQLLLTVADLISGMIHNAMRFQKAEVDATTDGLTWLYNRRFFDDALRAELKRSISTGGTFTVALFDLDKFKAVNDTFGHLKGDEVLKRVGDLLYQTCSTDQTSCRLGGDEFAILIPSIDMDRAYELVDGIRETISRDVLLASRKVTGSFGLANFPLHGSAWQEVIDAADKQMYVSKHAGGNRVSFTRF